MSGTSDEETKFAPTSQNFTSFAALFLPSLVDIIEFVKNFPRLVLDDDDDVAKGNGGEKEKEKEKEEEQEEEDHVAPLVKTVVVVLVVLVVLVRAFSTSRSPSSREKAFFCASGDVFLGKKKVKND